MILKYEPASEPQHIDRIPVAGELVAAGGVERSIRVWDAADGTQIAFLRGHDARRVPADGDVTDVTEAFVPCTCSLPRSPLAAVRRSPGCLLQVHLAHKKQRPPRTLQIKNTLT